MKKVLLTTIAILTTLSTFAQAPTNGLVAYYPFDGNANDAVGTNNGTVNGATLTTDRFGQSGRAYSFDGIDDWINAGTNLNFNTSFTISLHCNTNNFGNNPSLFSQGQPVTNGGLHVALINQSVYRFAFYGNDIETGSGFPPLNTWAHFVFSYNHQTQSRRIYLNGVLIANGNSVPYTGTGITAIGKNIVQDVANGRYNGKLDDIRIYNRALTDTEVQALYQAEAPPIDITTGLVAHYKMDGNAQDASGNSNHGTAQNGVTFGADRFGNAGKAASFDGVNDWINVTSSNTLKLPTTAITITNWINVDNISVGAYYLAKTNSSIFQYRCGLNGGMFLGYQNSNSGYVDVQNPSGTIPSSTWKMVSYVFNGQNVKFYIDGVLMNTVVSNGTIFPNNLPLEIGRDAHGPTEYFKGKLDDIRIYNRALSNAEVLALYASENVGFQNINPMISYGAGTVNRFIQPTPTLNQVLTVNGTNFTPNTNALLTISCPNSTRNFSVGVGATAQFAYPVVVDNTYAEGSCSISVKDISTKTSQIPLGFTILAGISSFDNSLVINNLNTNSSSQWTVGWSDLMFKEAIYGNSAIRNYRYTVEYGLANNSGQVTNWHSAGTLPSNANGVAILNSTQNFTYTFNPQYATTAGNYIIRVTDYLKNTRKTSSKLFTHNPSSVPITDINFLWDFTSDNRSNLLYGVAADSTSRFYVKITPNISGITNVEVLLEDDALIPATSTRLLGKIMRANVISQFSPEANTANSTTSNNTQPIGLDYWFWYVAPDDFTRSTLDNYISERIVNLRVKFYNGSTLIAEKIKPIRIVRPPVMFVHGLGGDRTTWRNFKHDGVLFKDDAVFKVRNILEMYGDKSFNENSKVLLGFDRSKYEYSFESTLIQMRNLGFASNRVDYVCHSMGGSMLRNTLHVPSFKQDFYNIYKNYGKGFVNKFITLNTPHWGSPLGDIVTEFAVYMNDEGFAIDKLKKVAKKDLQAFFDFTPIKKQILVTTGLGTNLLVEEEVFEDIAVTNAVRDLSYRSGIRFANNNLNNHVILGDYVKQFGQNPENAYSRVQKAIDLGALGLPILAEAISDGALKKFNSCNCKNESIYLQELRKNLGVQRYSGTGLFTNTFTYKFMNWQSNRVYPEGETFFQNSDMVVSVESQANGKIRLGTNAIPSGVSVYEDINHNFEPDKVVDNEAVGNKVYLLLNTPLSSADFAKNMQAAPAINSPYDCAMSCNPAPNNLAGKSPEKNKSQNFGGGNKIQINQPITGSSIAAMSQLNAQITVLDTVKLFYVETKFQDAREIESDKEQNLTYKFQADGKALGWQRMIASAVYKNVDSTFTTYTDTVWVNVTTTVPLTAISANKEIYKMIVGDKQYVDLTAYHESFSTGISFTNPNLTIVVQDTTIIQYSPTTGIFTALKDGVTSATATFNVQQTEILFYVDCGNSLYSIHSGDWNDADTWSCGRVPTVTSDVTISGGHVVTISNGQTGFVNNLTQIGTLLNTGNLRLKAEL